MKLDITIEVWKKEDWFVAKCPELDFIAQGKTEHEAKARLLEVIEIQFEEMAEMGTLDDYLSECGYERRGNALVSRTERIGIERYPLQVA